MVLKKYFFICMVLATTMTVDAQTISNDRLKDILRIGQLSGEYNRETSFTVNANQVSVRELDSILHTAHRFLPFKGSPKTVFQFLPATLVQQYNSALPYDWNNGPMIRAKGYQLMANIGVFAKIGKHITLQVSPEFVVAQNLDFEHFSQQLSDRIWAARYAFWNTADIPEQFGTGPYRQLFPGQSFLRYNTNHISFGISTENLWWGPGSRNALVMSTNAPGFLHATINTIKPLHTGIGNFEGQFIAGKLDNTAIEPPRINSAYNGTFLYQPKHNEWRYITGLVVTWQPKWVKDLYVGIAKTSYLYASDVTNPIDALPLQGFFGSTLTETEKNGKKASLGTLFARYILPAEHTELYAEYGRKDMSMLPTGIFRTNPYRRAYTAGFRKLFASRNKSNIALSFEMTQLEAPTGDLILQPDAWYTHSYVRQGYTQMGRVLGAGIGPGSNSQTLDISWVKGAKKIGLQFERVRYNNDFFYYAFSYTQDFRRAWVDLSTTLKADWNYKQFYFSGQAGLIRSLNYQWLIIQVDPNTFLIPGNEYLNFEGRLSISYRF